ncbi:MAG TPA: MFS transporter [Armatimonadota bacterium]|jgi:PPP family 3-phenylpropionic acid transporter
MVEQTLDARAPREDRRTAAAVAGYYFFSLVGLAIATPYLPLYWKSLGFGRLALGALLTAQGLGGLLAQGPIGYLSDRGGRRKDIVFGLFIGAALLMAVYPVWQSFWALFVVTLAISAAFNSGNALVQAMVADWAAGTRMASTYGRLRMAGSIGWVLCLLLAGRVAFMTDMRPMKALPWAAPIFLVVAAGYAAAACFALLATPAAGVHRLRLGPFTALKTVARAPEVGRFLVALALFWTGLQSINAFLSLFLKQMGAGRPTVSLAFVISAVAEIPFIFLAGRLADKYGERKLLMVAFGALPIRLLLYAVAPGPWLCLVAQTFHSVTYGLSMVGSVTYMSHRLPASLRASGQGALGVVMCLSSTAGPSLGAMAAYSGSYRWAFAAMAAIALAGFVVLKGLPNGIAETE